MQASADATWGAGLEDDGRELPSLVDLSEKDAEGRQLVACDLYSVLITFAGAVVHHTLRQRDRESAVKPRNRAYIPIWVRLYESRTGLSVIGIVGEGRGFCEGRVSASRARCGGESGIELNSDYYY